MSKLIVSLAILTCAAPALAQQELVYDNSTTNRFTWSPWDWPGNYSFPNEHGDHVNLAGTNRAVSQIDILYTNPLGNSVTTDIIVRLYDGDPTFGAAMIWSTTRTAEFFINNQAKTVTFTVPDVALSADDCTVTYEFTNIVGSPVGVGLQSFYPPTVGTSEGWFPAKVSGVWNHYTYGDSTLANFALRVYANAVENCVGDLDGDHDVDLSDLGVVLSAYGSCSGDAGYVAAADFDESGCIDLSDLGVTLSAYGQPCP